MGRWEDGGFPTAARGGDEGRRGWISSVRGVPRAKIEVFLARGLQVGGGWVSSTEWGLGGSNGVVARECSDGQKIEVFPTRGSSVGGSNRNGSMRGFQQGVGGLVSSHFPSRVGVGSGEQKGKQQWGKKLNQTVRRESFDSSSSPVRPPV